MDLTKSFTLEELIYSDTAKRKGINNTPNQDVINNLKYLAEQCLQPARDHFGIPIYVSSGYRCPTLNKAVGSGSGSFHQYGMAADIDFGDHSKYKLIDLFNFFYKRGIYTELIAEELPEGWIHVAIQRGREKENQLKYKLSGSGVKRGSYEEILSKLPK